MITQKHHLFRKEALERISSPERLDQIMQVVSFQKWIPLAAFGTLIISVVFWSVVGRIPVTVNGQGMLVFPSKVVALQSLGAGRLLTLKVRVGDVVKKGQVIATIDQAELQKKLQQSRAKLEQLQYQDSNASALQQQRIGLDQVVLQQHRFNLENSLQSARTVSVLLREKGLESIHSDRHNLQQRLQTIRDLLPTLRRRYEIRQQLFQEGVISGDTVLASRQELIDGEAKVNDAQSQLKQLDVKEADAQRQYLENLNSIRDIQAQLKELDTKKASQAQQDLDALTNRKKEIQETEREIAQLQLQLKNTSQIISLYTGQVIELSASPGQLIVQGTAIGSIEAQDPGGKLMSVAFFPAGEGKKLKSGMKLQITPTTVKREEFGGIVGTIGEISTFPITQEGAVRSVGSAEVVKGLLAQGPQLEAFATLEPDPSTFSSWKWSSSRGPRQKITSGTPTTVRVTVEERAPISFVFPILKSWTGVY
ncbi:NHLP bacteriocin system secretion protein [Nostoc sp. UHCC 0251]|uniref:NHLP bacteriocin system secretion protein n=1 Tax=Nostoc sp. UHCC 0251 TaxID=3110240 RepID=UPI002B1F5799|nr:NHLP bacteriocin system secretion protein [Nostoc sp. UHCC 0251]MEA5627193.1 NHLP bacteriocin system secretion protein [Nostoc sp. UHCC 0251]